MKCFVYVPATSAPAASSSASPLRLFDV